MCSEFQISISSVSAFKWNTVKSSYISVKPCCNSVGNGFIHIFIHHPLSFLLSYLYIFYLIFLFHSYCLSVLSSFFFPFLPFLCPFSYLIFFSFSHIPFIFCSFVCPISFLFPFLPLLYPFHAFTSSPKHAIGKNVLLCLGLTYLNFALSLVFCPTILCISECGCPSEV